jgi:hypothetical protein
VNIFLVNAGEYEILLKSIKVSLNSNNCYVLDNLIYKKKIEKYFIINDFIDFTENSRLNSPKYLSYSNNLSFENYDFYKKYTFNALDILDRYDYNSNSFSFEQRVVHYFQMINFYEDYVKRKKINLIFFNHTPHHINTYCLYLVCKKNKIKTLINTKFSYANETKFTIDNNIDERCHLIKKYSNSYLYNKIEKNLIKCQFNFSQAKYIHPRTGKYLKYFGIYYESFIFLVIREFIEILKNGLLKKSDYYLKIDSSKYFFEENKLSNLKSFFIRSILQRYNVFRIKKYYKKNTTDLKKIKTKKYCLFFPNYQPEATTSPSCDVFTNILLCLETIKSSIPSDWIIVYKEHPSTFNYTYETFFKKNIFFYESIKKKIADIFFVNYNDNNIDIIKNSKAVFVQSSNVAIHALIEKKPIIVFGNCWFDKITAIHKYSSVLSVKKYLSNDIKFYHNKIMSELENYFTSIKEFSFSLNNANNISKEIKKISKIIKLNI